MHIAFFSDNNYPEMSGITDTILITGRELKKRGHEILYIGPRYSRADYAVANRTYPETLAEDTVDGMPFVRLPSLPLPFSPTGQSRFAFPFGASYSRLHEFKPDIIHTQSPYGTGWEARNAAKRLKIPLIGTNHTAIEDFFPMGGLMRRFDARYYNHCDFVTTPYEGLLERMRKAGFKKEGRALANPAELSVFTPATPAERAEYKRALGLMGPVILYAGRLAPEKRADQVIRAMPQLLKRFPTATLILTGRGSAEAAWRTLSESLGISSSVRFAGFLPQQELAHIYKSADVFAMMSTSDSQCIALMQAYASGIPAVCARARGLPDYTPADCGFLVEPGDHQALAEKLSVLLEDDALRARMGAAAIQFVKKFSPEKIAEEWEKVYEKAIAQRPLP